MPVILGNVNSGHWASCKVQGRFACLEFEGLGLRVQGFWLREKGKGVFGAFSTRRMKILVGVSRLRVSAMARLTAG